MKMKQQYDAIWKKTSVPPHYKSLFPKKIISLYHNKKVKKILDLGSGDGTNILLLQKLGFEVYGIEISGEGIKKTREKIKDHKSKITLFQRDIFLPLHFEKNSFDAIFSFQALNHNKLPNIIALFQEVNRILKKGGIFSVKTADRESYNLKKIEGSIYFDMDLHETFRFLDEQTYIPLDGKEKGLVHYAFYKDQLNKEICKRGFKLIVSTKTKWHILSTFEKVGKKELRKARFK